MLLKHQRKLFQTKEASSRIPWTSSRTSWLNFVDWIFLSVLFFLSVFCNTCIHWVQIHLCVRRCECVNPLSGVTAVRMCDIIAPSRIKVSARRRHTDTDWSWDETGQTPVIVKKRKKKKNQKLLRLVLRLIINYCDWRKTIGLIGRPAESFIWLWFLLEYFWETVCQ